MHVWLQTCEPAGVHAGTWKGVRLLEQLAPDKSLETAAAPSPTPGAPSLKSVPGAAVQVWLWHGACATLSGGRRGPYLQASVSPAGPFRLLLTHHFRQCFLTGSYVSVSL